MATMTRWPPRQESNLYLALRRHSFYPLNYGERGRGASVCLRASHLTASSPTRHSNEQKEHHPWKGPAASHSVKASAALITRVQTVLLCHDRSPASGRPSSGS